MVALDVMEDISPSPNEAFAIQKTLHIRIESALLLRLLLRTELNDGLALIELALVVDGVDLLHQNVVAELLIDVGSAGGAANCVGDAVSTDRMSVVAEVNRQSEEVHADRTLQRRSKFVVHCQTRRPLIWLNHFK